MSKIGKKPILIPEKIKLEMKDSSLMVEGPLGTLKVNIPSVLKVETKENQLLLLRLKDDKKAKMLHGTIRQLINNAIKGVTEGWKKELEVKGTGFRVGLENEVLVLNLGFSHPVMVKPPLGIKFEAKEGKISVFGPDKALVSQVAAKIRRIYPPDAYKGKGIKYLGEQIILKPGKTIKTGATVGK